MGADEPRICACGCPNCSDATDATEVRIRRAVDVDGAVVYVVSDEDSEFARSTTIADALHYASDLLHGPGTGPRGMVWNLLRAAELYCRSRPSKPDPVPLPRVDDFDEPGCGPNGY